MKADQITNAIKCLDKQSRQDFAKTVRTEPTVWNGINGIGNIPENLPKGKIQGLVKAESKLISKVRIIAKQGEQVIAESESDNEGMYSIELGPGMYDIIYSIEGYYDTVVQDQGVISEVLTTVNAELTKMK